MSYENSQLYKLRHSLAHIMAQAVLELFPDAKLGIGPPIADGFYYDFDLGVDERGKARTFSAASKSGDQPPSLPQIESRMRQIIAERHWFEVREWQPDALRTRLADQPYKLELIDEIVQRGERLTTFRHDSFEDLCQGPHVEHTGKIAPDGFKLLSSAGAYWRGDEERPMLQRIYGTVWANKKQLKAHLAMLEEAKKRDHRKLGRELELFIFDDDVGAGLPLWLPKGNILREQLERLAHKMEANYERVSTPHIAKESLFQQTGHLPYYKDEMYAPSERGGTRYYLRPMNCPFHHKIFASKPRTYRDLPVRLAEYGMVYRYEQSGSLFGLLRVRAAQQNDAHIYCTEAQVEEEFLRVIDLYKFYFDLFGIEKYEMRLSKHAPNKLGKKYADHPELWLKTEQIVRDAMLKSGVPFVEAEDEAAFYGPKIDVQVWSAIGREFSLATNQIDFVVPRRLGLSYRDADGNYQVPLCIHRAPLGSHERFIGFLIEHFNGAFPVWLAPVQVKVIPIADRHHAYAHQVADNLMAAGLRVEVDDGSERMNKKIRNAQMMKIPYMLVVGDKEAEAGAVAVRTRNNENRGAMPLADFITATTTTVTTRSLDL